MKKIILLLSVSLLAQFGFCQERSIKLEPETVESSDVYDIVEIMPEFPGGNEALYRYIAATIHYPDSCYKNEIQGKVYVQFIIEKDGGVHEAKILRGVHSLIDQEALRVVLAMPKWKPGKQNGKAVRTRYNLPIIFKLK